MSTGVVVVDWSGSVLSGVNYGGDLRVSWFDEAVGLPQMKFSIEIPTRKE